GRAGRGGGGRGEGGRAPGGGRAGRPRAIVLPAGSSAPCLRSGQAGSAKARSRFPGRNSPAPLPTKTIPRAIAGPPAIGEPGGDSQTGSPSRARQARSFPSIRPMKTTPPATESGPNWKAGGECSQRISPVAASIPATRHVLSAWLLDAKKTRPSAAAVGP